MVLWIGFIGKLVELILTKIDGKYVDLRLDERKQAARAFLALHEALIQLEAVAVGIRDEINAVLAGRRSYLWRGPFGRIVHRGDDASRAFADSLRELHPLSASPTRSSRHS